MSGKRELCASARRVVIKVGTRVLLGNGRSMVDRATFVPLVQAIAREINEANRHIVLVSSGAVGLGRRRIDETRDTGALRYLQACAALGQSALMQLYEHEFAYHDVLVGQVLLTQADIDDRKRFINARHTIRLLAEELHAIPIVNENDTVANEELRLGDNDRLAALVASLFDADLLLLLSDVDGLYTADPSKDPSAVVLPEVETEDPSLDALIWESPRGPGRGGMSSKLVAARMAAKAGIPSVIAPGRQVDAVARVFDGEPVGTLFVPPATSISARRLWILHGVTSLGRIVVDAGAARALTKHGKSLLPSGITAVEGQFNVGAAVDIVDPSGATIARGLASYNAADTARIVGHNTSEIAAILGYKTTDEVIHRDDLVLVPGQ